MSSNNNTSTIISQPVNQVNSSTVISYQDDFKSSDKSVEDDHQCKCEHIIKKMCHCGNGQCYDTGIYEWLDGFRLYTGFDRANDDGCCYGCLCFPVTLPLRTTCCLPCAVYNTSRNKCKGTKNLNYLC
jgi:hypothetical protein